MPALFSTVFLYPWDKLDKLVKAKDVKEADVPVASTESRMREIRGFCYAMGHNLPLPKPLVATERETNLDLANQLPDSLRNMFVTSFEWSIPAVADKVYQQGLSGRDYKVTAKDVAEFASKAYIAFYCGGEKPFAEAVPASKEILFDGNEYTQVVSDSSRFQLEMRRLEKMWTSIVWNHGVLPDIGGVIPVRFILRSEAVSENVRPRRRVR